MQVALTKAQYLSIRKPLPIKHIAVRYNEPGISQYSKSAAKPIRLVTKSK